MSSPADVKAIRACTARIRRVVKSTKRRRRAVAARQGAMMREYRKGRVEDDKLFHRQLLEDECRFNRHLLELIRGSWS